MQRKENRPFSPYIKSNSKEINDLNVRPETLKALEQNIWKSLQDIDLGKDFFEYDLQNTGNESTSWDLGVHQIKKLLSAQQIKWMSEEQHTEWEKIFENYLTDGVNL